MECIQSTNVNLCKGQILADAGGQGSKLKVAMRNLDILGYIMGGCGFLTDLERINRVRRYLQIADSITEIICIKYNSSAYKEYEHATKMIEFALKTENVLTEDIYTVCAYICGFNSSQDL